MTSRRGCAVRTASMGIFTRSCRATTFLNMGVSVIVRRTYSPTITRAALARNGIRHPNAKNCPSVRKWDSAMKIPPEKKKPRGLVLSQYHPGRLLALHHRLEALLHHE